MSLSQAMSAGVSGVLAHQAELDNIGNNLANVNTTGFRRGILQFEDLFSQMICGGSGPAANLGGVNPLQVGLGVNVAGVSQDFSQGGLETTGRPSDLAIEGDGFFIVARGDTYFYTRDGSFGLDPLNQLVNSSGFYVQGTNLDPVSGIVPDPSQSTIENVVIPLGSVGRVRETENAFFTGNLNASGEIATTGTRMESERLFERVADGSDALLSASTGAGNTVIVPTAGDAARVVAGDTIYLAGTGLNSGLYTVTATDGNTIITIAETITAGLTAVTVHLPATSASDLQPVTPGGATGTIGGVYDDEGLLLLGNYAATGGSYIDVTGALGDRTMTERFDYGAPTVPTGDPATEFNGTTLADLAAFLEDVFGINAAYDPNADRPEIPHQIPVGFGGDEGVADGDAFNESGAVYGRSAALPAGLATTGTGALATSAGGTVGARLTASAGSPFLGITVGTTIRLSGTGVTDGCYTITSADAGGTWVELGETTGPGAENSAGPTGVTGVNWELAPNRLYVNGNLGEDNAISNIRLSSGSTDLRLFEGGVLEAANGESATTTITVYDSAGGAHLLEVTTVLVNRTSEEATWRWYALSGDDTTLVESPNPFSPPGPPVMVSGTGTDRAVGWGDIVFDQNGLFVRNEIDASGAARTINIDLEDLATDPNLTVAPDFSLMTQFAAQDSRIDLFSQDGYPAGTLQSFSVSMDGTIMGIYSNGVTQPVGVIALAGFTNPDGLVAEGGNLFREGLNSGTARIGRPQSGGLGITRSGTLELSNVDLAKEFTDLIVAQRGFQANARTIRAADELLSDLMRTI